MVDQLPARCRHGVVTALAMPGQYRTIAMFAGAPFFVIDGLAAWR
jgi:hypothetical protein